MQLLFVHLLLGYIFSSNCQFDISLKRDCIFCDAGCGSIGMQCPNFDIWIMLHNTKNTVHNPLTLSPRITNVANSFPPLLPGTPPEEHVTLGWIHYDWSRPDGPLVATTLSRWMDNIGCILLGTTAAPKKNGLARTAPHRADSWSDETPVRCPTGHTSIPIEVLPLLMTCVLPSQAVNHVARRGHASHAHEAAVQVFQSFMSIIWWYGLVVIKLLQTLHTYTICLRNYGMTRLGIYLQGSWWP